jgi:hypothetical protein
VLAVGDHRPDALDRFDRHEVLHPRLQEAADDERQRCDGERGDDKGDGVGLVDDEVAMTRLLTTESLLGSAAAASGVAAGAACAKSDSAPIDAASNTADITSVSLRVDLKFIDLVSSSLERNASRHRTEIFACAALPYRTAHFHSYCIRSDARMS